MHTSLKMLADRMAAGRLSVGEALRIGMSIADELRQLHDQGTVHGALTPSLIELTGGGTQLYASPDASKANAYSAPEVAAGKRADARSDIFSFGAIFYEMLTGCPAFERGSDVPAPSGSAAVDRLVRACLAKSPDARFQRTQKLILELKVLSNAARRGAPAPAPAPAPVFAAAPVAPVAPVVMAAEPAVVTAPTIVMPAPAPAVAEVSDLERRMAARFEEQERSVASVAQVANEVLKALREQQQPQRPAAAPSAQNAGPRLHARGFTSPMEGVSSGRIEQVLEEVADRVARLDLVVSSAVERLQKLEENLDAFDTDAAALRDSVTRDIRNFERALKAQSTAIESARTAMGQTDDLVERVVEALDSLQSMFVNTSDERSLAS
jgi:hypothetical protein